MTTLPNLEDLTNLQHIQLENNRLTQIQGLINPYLLYLENNLFTEMPVIAEPERIAYLIMSKNPLKHIMSIGNLINLIDLRLRNTTITFVPPTIDKLKNLQLIDLSENRLTYLPNNMLKLKTLRQILLQKNSFPQEQLTTIRSQFNTSLPNCSLAF